MTDYSEAPFDFWQTHARLRPYVEAGLLDFARFDAERDEEIRLRASGDVLAAGAVKNPLAVIANYVLDSIPHDAFSVIDGKLHECRVSVTSDEPGAGSTDPDLLNRLHLEYEHLPVEGAYYEEPDWDRVLLGYERRLSNTVVTFPVAGLRCLDRLQSFSGGRTLLLCGDKGHDRKEELLGCEEVSLSLHGSFSLMVNFHALGEVVRAKGGEHLRPPQAHAHLAVSAFLLGEPADGYTETRQAFQDNISRGGPDEFYALKKGIETFFSCLSLEQLLAYLRVSGWDANIFWRCSEDLIQRAKAAPKPARRELFLAARQVWDNYFPIGEAEDVASSLGELMQTIGFHPAALEYYGQSLRLHGPSATSYCGLARSHLALWQLEEADDCAAKALEVLPDWGPARALRIEIEECRRRQDVIALDLAPAPGEGENGGVDEEVCGPAAWGLALEGTTLPQPWGRTRVQADRSLTGAAQAGRSDDAGGNGHVTH
jgi:tetratricopeptide (TPR) repeat protein